MSSTIVFDIIARDRASDKFDKIGDSASKSSGKLKKFAKAGAAGFAAAGGAALVGGKYVFDLGAKLEQMDAKATTVFGNQRGQVDSWAKKNAAAMGLSKREATGLAANFADLLIPMGFARKEAAKMSTDVVGLSGALSQWSGGTKSAAEVTDILNAAMLGETDGLKALGISISAAEVEAKLLAKGQKDLTGQAKQQAEAQAIQSLIFAKSTDAQKKFAEGGSPLLASQAKLSAMFKNTRDDLVMKLVPAMGKAAEWATKNLGPAMREAGDWVKTKLIPPIKQFAEDMAPKAARVVDALKQGFQDAKPFLELAGKALTSFVLPALKWLVGASLDRVADTFRVMGKMLGKIGEAGKWMWNNALQPAFKFLADAIAVVLDGFSSMLGALGKVPGFGWAKDAAVAMGKAAEKARAVADGITKIPNKKTVVVTVATKYTGLRAPGGSGSTRSTGDDHLGILPRVNRVTIESATTKFFDAIADGIKKGGDKLDKVLVASRDRLRDKLSGLRDEMASVSSSIASALNNVDFGGSLQEHLASLTGTNGALTQLMAVFQNLKDGASKGYLSALMQSGNIGLATALANDPAALAQASSLYDSNAAIAKGLGDQTAQTVMGDQIEAALEKGIEKLINELREAPEKQARKTREKLEGLRLELTGQGRDPGRGAYLRGALG